MSSFPQLKHFAELGLGTNPCGIFGRSILEDEKVLGTAHIGFGNDTFLGGINSGPHLDGVLKDVTLEVGNKRIINNGKLHFF